MVESSSFVDAGSESLIRRAALKSVHPVNLLSFGPETEPIELRNLNILIGTNGSGKSNFIEVIRLLHFLPDKEPWGSVLVTGGVGEWIWKGSGAKSSRCSLGAEFCLAQVTREVAVTPRAPYRLVVELQRYDSSFRVLRESIGIDAGSDPYPSSSRYDRDGSQGRVFLRLPRESEGPIYFDLSPDRSVLSQLASRNLQMSGVGQNLPELYEIAELLESFDFHQDWDFGVDCAPRDPQPVGQQVANLEENGVNLAQMLAHFRDNEKATFARLTDLVKLFYEPVKSVEIRLVSTHLQIAIEEKSGFSVPAYRLSDGMLRWLAILAILLNPSPAPITCIDEPELGLHPDIIPTLADLLRDASSRTQLIVTTHSSTLVDAFSDDPGAVCVAEKENGSTQIRRLNKDDLASWLRSYSLGNLWTSGEIGGNRW